MENKDKVVFRGSLSQKKLFDLCIEQEGVVIIQQQPDGNWKGFGKKFGKLIESREQMPEHALTKILMHP